MNLKKLLVLFALLACATMMFAQFATFSSFRATSTGSVLESDIEAITTAAELPYVDGFNVYTNLSNFYYGSEYVFDGWSPNYLVGFKGDYSNMLHAGVLMASYNYMYDNQYTYTDVYNVDTDGDEIYDLYERYIDNDHSFQVDQGDDNYFGFAFGQKDATKVGFSYSRGAYKSINNYGFDAIIIDSSIISGEYLAEMNELYFDNYTYNGVYQDFALSFYQPFGSMEAGLIFKYGPFTEVDTESYYDSVFHNGDPTAATPAYYDYYVEQRDFYDKYNATRIVLGGVFFQRMNEDSIEMGLNYTNVNVPTTIVTASYSERYYEIYPTYIDPYTYSEVYTETAGDSSYYKGSENTFLVYLKYVKKLDKAMFGMGAAYMNYNESYEEQYMETYSYTEEYDNGNGIVDAGDYTITENGDYTYLEQSNYGYNVFVFPVGLEYNIWGGLSFRLGAMTYLSWSNSDLVSRVTEFNPGTGVYTDGEGYTYEYLVQNPSNRSDYTSVYKSFNKGTDFSYGASYKVSENVTIDLMNFYDLTDMTNWQLSAKVKF